eukprot:8334694-Lingulodinium_polyedra.AAC.1
MHRVDTRASGAASACCAACRGRRAAAACVRGTPQPIRNRMVVAVHGYNVTRKHMYLRDVIVVRTYTTCLRAC